MIAPLFGSITRPLLSPLVSGLRDELFGAFTPRSLFNDGSIGVLYDNNDLTTMFLDAAGTTPATVNGLVGLQLDKSANLSATATAIDGNMNTATWTKGTGWTATGPRSISCDGSNGATSDVSATYTKPASKFVRYSFNVTAISGTLTVYPTSSQPAFITTTGQKVIYSDFGSNFNIFRANAGTTCTITDIRIEVVDGNHRYQTTTGSKPILRGTPTGSNLVTNGDFASDVSGWTAASGGSISWAGGKLRVTNGGGGRGTGEQAFTTVVGKVYRVRFSATAGTAASAFFGVAQGSGAASFIAGVSNSLGTDFYFTAVGTTTYVYAQPNITTAGVYIDVDNIEIHDVSAGQVTAPYGLQYDGVDDFMQTASVNFTATDKMFVCAGVRKLSDAIAFGMVCETSTDLNSNNGGFYVVAPNVASTPSFGFVSKGTTQSGAAATPGYPAPYLGVVCGIGSISGDSAIIRVNGVQAGSSATDQGTGNYGNYVIYFGRRGGASLPYNGLDFGFVIVGKTLTAAQISSTERWMAQRTGVSI